MELFEVDCIKGNHGAAAETPVEVFSPAETSAPARAPRCTEKNSLGGLMTNNFNSVMSCFVKGAENSIALHGRILCTGINDLVSKGRLFESTHPVYK